MTYEAQETGQGYPVELYKFSRGVTAEYLLTSSDSNITFGGEDYSTTQIKRTKIEQTGEMERNEITVMVQRDSPILANFVGFPRTEIMTLTIFREHLNDTDSEFIIIWQGRVLTADFKANQGVLTCEPIYTSLKRPGLWRKYQAQCPHVLYGSECQIDEQSFRSDGVIIGIVDFTIQATVWTAFADDYFDGGFVIFDGVHKRAIVASTATGILTLSSTIAELEIGETVQAFPGCNHDLADCLARYNNIVNYGGFPYIPSVNPFNGTVIY